MTAKGLRPPGTTPSPEKFFSWGPSDIHLFVLMGQGGICHSVHVELGAHLAGGISRLPQFRTGWLNSGHQAW